jgi:hypothetical protein
LSRVSFTTVDGVQHDYEVPAHVTMSGPGIWRYACGHFGSAAVPCLLAQFHNMKAAAKLMCPKCREEALPAETEFEPGPLATSGCPGGPHQTPCGAGELPEGV